MVKKMGIGILGFLIIAAIYFFLPVGFGRLSLEGEYKVKISVNGEVWTATMANNTSSQAFKSILKKGPKTINMRDYASMEKVGMIGRTLPSNNEQIRTKPGDIILFMGGSLVVYYQPNSWNFTKLGHIDDVSQETLIKTLGDGRVKMTFELLED